MNSISNMIYVFNKIVYPFVDIMNKLTMVIYLQNVLLTFGINVESNIFTFSMLISDRIHHGDHGFYLIMSIRSATGSSLKSAWKK